MERQLIDLTALKEKIAKPDYTLYNGSMRADWIEKCINTATIVKIENVAPVVHGRWIKEKPDVIVHWGCSACRNCYYLDEPNAKYCPNCGAKMDMEGENNDSQGNNQVPLKFTYY